MRIWFELAQRSLTTYHWQRTQGDDRYWRNKAAFELHQVTEQLYHCTLLTLTLYSPKSHNLNFLRRRVEGIAPAPIAAWPRADRVSRRRFALVREAYVKARYSRHYKITDEELRWIAERIGASRRWSGRSANESLRHAADTKS